MYKKIAIILLIIIIISLIPVEIINKADAAFVIDDAIITTVVTAMIASGITFYGVKAMIRMAKEFIQKSPDNVKDKIAEYAQAGAIICHPVLMDRMRNYRIKVKNDIDVEGVYRVTGPVELELLNTEEMELSRYFDQKNMLTGGWQSRMTVIKAYIPKDSMLRVLWGSQAGNPRVLHYDWDDLTHLKYRPYGGGEYELADTWVRLEERYSNAYTLRDVEATFLVDGYRGIVYVYFDDVDILYKCYGQRTGYLTMHILKDRYVGERTYKHYEYAIVESVGNPEFGLDVDDLSWGDVPLDVTGDDVIMQDTPAELDEDVVINIPQVDSIEDLLGKTYDDIGDISVTTTGIYGLLLTFKAWLINIYNAIISLVSVLTSGIVGDISEITLPEVDVGLITLRFPFSLPWDLKNAITALDYEGEIPVFNLILPVGVGIVNMQITIPQEFRFIITFVRASLLILFCISMIYITPKIIGGAK